MIKCLSRVEMVCGNPDATAVFYQEALGFQRSDRDPTITITTLNSVRLQLGKQEIALVGSKEPGRPYPANVGGWSPLFQHIAIVVSDMASAYARLATGWISDRTVCYLASGRPVVVQHTGPTRLLAGDGVRRFRTPGEAVSAIDEIERDYERHASAARSLAEAWVREKLPDRCVSVGNRNNHQKSERGKFANISARFWSISSWETNPLPPLVMPRDRARTVLASTAFASFNLRVAWACSRLALA